MKTVRIILISIALFCFANVNSQNLKKIYKNEVKMALAKDKTVESDILTENDIQHLPHIVQKYLKYAGVIGKEKIHNFRVEFQGKIRSNENSDWMNLKSVQYNFVNQPLRAFYISAKKMGIPAIGLHLYKNEKAIMIIKMFGLFKIVDASGNEMNQGETVTVFNDMCFMAPASLIDKNIKWESIDSLTVKAKYTNGNISVMATLFFNNQGELINFISNDRFETTDGKTYKNYPWITPVTKYNDFNGYRLPAGARVIYQHPDGDFCYGEFTIKNIEYNCSEFK